MRKEILLAKFWGFSLFQFFADADGDITYEAINRKHYNPVSNMLLRYQGDTHGRSLEEFPHTLFVGSQRGLGVLAEILPAVLYKRGNIADWAKFCNIFGMPIREYTYDAGDETTRKQLIADASRQGANAVYIHPKESGLNLIESGGKSGTGDLYEAFTRYWDSQISVRILGNTLTTDAQSTGTQALGTIHKEVEEQLMLDDREFILDVLNYRLIDIFAELGWDVAGGEFSFVKESSIDPNQHIDIVTKLSALGLPISDEYLYETFGIDKPDNYKELKEQIARRVQPPFFPMAKTDDLTREKERLNRFFDLAP